MFHEEFYPTPKHIADKMVAKAEDIVRKHRRSDRKGCLDPSAGKGDLLEAVKRYRGELTDKQKAELEYSLGRLKSHLDLKKDYSNYASLSEFRGKIEEIEGKLKTGRDFGLGRKALHAYELNHDLQEIVKSKGAQVHGSDFLRATFFTPVEYVVMNPPFSNGIDHLLHVWNTVDATAIVCLLNATNYYEPINSKREQLVRLVERFGEAERLGSVFSDSERHTNVDVVMITLIKPEVKSVLNLQDDFEKIDFKVDLSEDNSQIIAADKIGRMEAYFKAYREALKVKKKLDSEILSIAKSLGFERDLPIVDIDIEAELKKRNAELWSQLLRDTDYKSLMSSSVYDEFMKKFATQKEYMFSRENASNLVEALVANAERFYLESLVECFDRIAWRSTKNRQELVDGGKTSKGSGFGKQGWRTNDAFLNLNDSPHIIKRKFVYPFPEDSLWGGPKIEYYSQYSFFNVNDLDRVLCRLAGLKMDQIRTIYDSYADCRKRKEGNKFQSTFFDCVWYKKGTIHFTFRDERLYQWFVCKAAEHKGYPLNEAEEVYATKPNIKPYLKLNEGTNNK